MKQKRLLSAVLALVMAFAVFAPAAQAFAPDGENETIAITPIAGDGVTLDYDADNFTLSVTPMYGMYRVTQSKSLTVTASFVEGWTYSETYSAYFSSHSDQVTVTNGANGSMTFTFNAHAGDFLSKDELNTVGIYATAAELPRLEINAVVPFSQINKETYVDATFTLTLGTKQFSGGDYEGAGSIKGRGNTSWGQPKKPYSIKLSSKASLLGIPKTKKYAIIPSYSDNSLMRNFMAYKSALLLEGIDYVPKCEFCEVYLNGVYNGIYILVERVSIESNKIDIEEASEDDLTGGYLIEKDIDGKIDFSSDQWFNCPYWANQSQDFFVLKEPEPDDPALLSQMLSYLTNYMQRLHGAVMGTSGEDYEDYVDIPSWADFIIFQELAKNIDGNLKTSCYMIKQSNDDHLYMTAPWDFDLAFGNPATTWNNASHQHNDYYDCPDATGTADFMVINSSCPWFDTLYDDHPEFRETVMGRYASYRDTLVPRMLSLLDSQAAYLANAMPRDEQKWGVRFTQGFAQLKSWLTGRIEWLDSVWLPEGETIDLDEALNVDGGHLSFETNEYPFRGTIKDGRLCAVSTNGGQDSTESDVTITLQMTAGQTVSFDYKVSSEGSYDEFKFKVNGATVCRASGESDWESYTYTAEADGSYTFIWRYSKDYSVASGADCAWVDNIAFSGDTIDPTPIPTPLLGDANNDGAVDSTDALIVLRFALGSIGSVPNAHNADVNADGVIDSQDALIILRMALGIIS